AALAEDLLGRRRPLLRRLERRHHPGRHEPVADVGVDLRVAELPPRVVAQLAANAIADGAERIRGQRVERALDVLARATRLLLADRALAAVGPDAERVAPAQRALRGAGEVPRDDGRVGIGAGR